MPIRQQRTRKRRETPANAVYVGRGSRWANPFTSARFGHARATGLHRAWLIGRLSSRTIAMLGFNEREALALSRLRHRMLDGFGELYGKDLICWCPRKSRWCHADTLIALANAAALDQAA